jgi:hypothetical protein
VEFQWLLANPVIERDDDAPGMMQEQRDPSDLLVRPHASLSHHHPCPSRSSQLGWMQWTSLVRRTGPSTVDGRLTAGVTQKSTLALPTRLYD